MSRAGSHLVYSHCTPAMRSFDPLGYPRRGGSGGESRPTMLRWHYLPWPLGLARGSTRNIAAPVAFKPWDLGAGIRMTCAMQPDARPEAGKDILLIEDEVLIRLDMADRLRNAG